MEASDGPGDVIYLQMSKAEALVLFEWVHRHEDNAVTLDTLVNDEAERDVLWSISGALERLLPEPFRQDYADVLAAAKLRIHPPGDGA